MVTVDNQKFTVVSLKEVTKQRIKELMKKIKSPSYDKFLNDVLDGWEIAGGADGYS